ncbi:hypothetical protein Kpho02_60370 [Kitasatospora phosalacinea]|uniref:Uncharacterized protein n=1 Tax=Kitasatospora phosalacinea TaxID=2065 RepID=A0A9W6QCP5_9ACTN|nr:hypothetical protein Kpho02_60370 [Kitasatospora phosalacinea]
MIAGEDGIACRRPWFAPWRYGRSEVGNGAVGVGQVVPAVGSAPEALPPLVVGEGAIHPLPSLAAIPGSVGFPACHTAVAPARLHRSDLVSIPRGRDVGSGRTLPAANSRLPLILKAGRVKNGDFRTT